MASLRYIEGVTTLEYTETKCVGCQMCLQVCPHGVFGPSESKVVLLLDEGACIECGACARNCPAQAIKVRAGVGCAAYIINGLLGVSPSDCCCAPPLDGEEEESCCGGSSCC